MTDNNLAKGEGFADLFAMSGSEKIWEPKVVKGLVTGFDGNYVIIDVGLKSEGRVEKSEFTSCGRQMELKVGDFVDVYIDRYEDKSGEVVLSREKALKEAAWDDFEKAYKDGVRVTGSIFNKVKGGFMVDLGGTVAFLPGSQVDVRPVKDISPLMGIQQPFVIIKMDKIRGNIVVSRRAILEESNTAEVEKVVSKLEEGQVIKGIVKNIAAYGAFVDIGGVDGLLHNTDLSWKRVTHPSELLHPGQEIQVMVLKFNKESKRISLGMKQLVKDPWEGVDQEFPVGSKIHGKVTNVTDYGIFVEIKEGVEGLVYVSEISWKKNVPPSKMAAVGSEIDVVVLDVDVSKRRMGLGMKQLSLNPWEHITLKYKVGDILEGAISNITDFGIFVKITDEVDGMVHVNDLSWDKSAVADISKFKKGDLIKVKILEIDKEKERVSLSVKHLEESPYEDVVVDIKEGVVVTCVVNSIQDDGISVILANGVPGFVKKGDLAKDREDRRTDRFAVGEKVDAKIISVDKGGKKVSLSVKALEIHEEKVAMAEYGSSDSGASLGDILGAAMTRAKDK